MSGGGAGAGAGAGGAYDVDVHGALAGHGLHEGAGGGRGRAGGDGEVERDGAVARLEDGVRRGRVGALPEGAAAVVAVALAVLVVVRAAVQGGEAGLVEAGRVEVGVDAERACAAVTGEAGGGGGGGLTGYGLVAGFDEDVVVEAGLGLGRRAEGRGPAGEERACGEGRACGRGDGRARGEGRARRGSDGGSVRRGLVALHGGQLGGCGGIARRGCSRGPCKLRRGLGRRCILAFDLGVSCCAKLTARG